MGGGGGGGTCRAGVNQRMLVCALRCDAVPRQAGPSTITAWHSRQLQNTKEVIDP